MRSLLIALSLTFVLTSCDHLDDPHDHDHDHEAVTTVTLELIEQGTTDTTRVTWEDLDGIGGNNPNRIDTLALKSGKTYLGTVRFENRAKSPAENITEEVLEDANEHQVFFAVTNQLGVVTVLDKDGRGLPLGLVYSIATTDTQAAEPGTLTLSLYHYESESSKNGTDPADETDVEVTFPLIVR
ncbi:MAG: type 1 periplasmic binding fold superfamily protein [Candidatus Kapabacteria bacterium]|nr:type 1 periplasmic binding fold superfamily protein [Candidatus Kapabacteria bacterium]